MLDKKMLMDLQDYIERKLAEKSGYFFDAIEHSSEIILEYKLNKELDAFINNKRRPKFNQVLFSFIDKKGLKDPDVYKKAGIDRRHFAKIRNKPDYRIGKNTAIALAIALELNKKETDKLLSAAGYSLSNSDTFDLIIQFFLERKIFDIHDINQALVHFSLKPLAGALE